MTKRQICQKIAQQCGFSERYAEMAFDAFIETAQQAFRRRERVMLHGLGTFKVVRRKAKIARNPYTNEPHPIPPAMRIKFAPYKELMP